MDVYSLSGSGAVKPPDSLSVSDNNSSGEAVSTEDSFQNSMENLMKRFESMGTSRITHNHAEESAISRIKTQCIIYLLRLLFGRETDLGDSDEKGWTFEKSSGKDTALSLDITGYEAHYYAESEELSYSTAGKVVTADGREIDFDLSFQMSRSFEQFYEKEHTFNIASLCDPLVINLDTDIASVSDQKFLFDLDSDGVKDSISMPGRGSGFLALDKNGDGTVNDGSELFGPSSGDGFKDLAAYDSDGNGWIDEADEVWDKLVIYSMNEDGTSSVYGLSEKGVGAIFLGNVSTDYVFRNSQDNSLNAMVRKTGIFLYENGNAGTVQHLDIAR
ncbi:MAG: hypothetical protein K5857_06750 [Lachnospiraceae bacterium]|nr:hypothetical protein [Lachnospiraceae bacterium]